ncbi:MAG: DUF308 domain-containing protein [Saccharofermentans sp.]|nr:DUF308 domain-containing protein [Saccharofermentans sp.]
MSPERIKSVRNHMIIASILLLLIGVAFIVWPDEAARILARATAIAIIGVGVFEMILFFIGKHKGIVDIPAIISGVLLIALGVYLLIQPDTMLNFFNIIFGIIILIIGLDHLFQAIFIIRHVRSLWWITLIVGVAAIGLGVLILVNPFSAVRTAMILVGITMVVEAIGGFWNLPALKAKPAALKEAVKDEDINA